ncbi:type I-E CRISPR-associated protein Cas5/CasD [Streptomyces sp. NPDC004244]
MKLGYQNGSASSRAAGQKPQVVAASTGSDLRVTGKRSSATPGHLLHETAAALVRPQWPLYLGRRSCPPEGPLLLGSSNDALHHLLHLPIAAPPPRPVHHLDVTFTSDRPLNRLPVPEALRAANASDGDVPAGQINDQPDSFHPRGRSYRARPAYQRTLRLPAAQYTGLGTAHLHTLGSYTTEHLTQPESSSR